jgi:ubiquinone/menaquinone biosynthesis C-methylase UbiE
MHRRSKVPLGDEIERHNRRRRTMATFDGAAPCYDSVIPWFTHFGRVLSDAVQVRPNESVLDVATGRGAVLFAILGQFAGPRQLAVGIDITERMASLTRDEISHRGDDHAEVLVADGESLPFASHSFDVITCGNSLNFFHDTVGALKEMHRVLRSGGRIGITLVAKRSPGEAMIDFFPEMARRHLPPDSTHRPRPRELDVESLLSNAGFDVVDVGTAEATFEFPDEESWWSWASTHGDRVFFDLLDRDSLQTLKAQCFARLYSYAEEGAYVLRDRVLVAVAKAR